MKAKILLFVIVAIITTTSTILLFKNEFKNIYTPRNIKNSVCKYDANGAIEWLNKRRVNQITGILDLKDVLRTREEIRAFINKKTVNNLGFSWTEMGPNNIGGRTRAILIDKDDSNIIFAGSVSGGLWKSTNGGNSWAKVNPSSDYWSILNIASICQTTNGDIYVGTGEGMYNNLGIGVGGLEGHGIWKSIDKGATFNHLTSTWNTPENQLSFVNVNKLATDPNNENKVYAATKKGLKVTLDGGQTWKSLFPITLNVKECTDVEVATDGTVITAIDKKAYISANGDSGTFVKKTAASSINYLIDSLINPNVGRLEFAFAPTNHNYIYCSASKIDGTLENIYRSTDKGEKWVVIGAGGNSQFQPFSNQGNYNNSIAVFPDNQNKILLGGIDLWKWEGSGMFEQISLWSLPVTNPSYIHADIHTIVFHPYYNSNKTLYIGNDGGISKSTNAASTFSTLNLNYNVAQFYSVGFSSMGYIVGGTQDNGTQYIDFTGSTSQSARTILGGDGGYCHISALDPKIMYASMPFGNIYRSQNNGTTMNAFFNTQAGSFVSNFRIWESFNDIYSIDSVNYLVIDTLTSGQVITGKSSTNNLPITVTYNGPIKFPGEIIKLKDYYQSMFALGLNNKLILSRKPLNFSTSNTTQSATNIVGTVETLEFSKDGNYLYIGTNSGNIYRVDSLWYYRTITHLYNIKADLIASFTNRAITSIAVDPQNSSNVIVTLGNYGNNEYIFYSTNASTTTTATGNFVSKQGDLPKMPVYSSLILWNDSYKVLIGTEYGIFSCTDITASVTSWSYESNPNSGYSSVATFMLSQQIHENNWLYGISNHGCIFAGTHGRGIWKSESNLGPVSKPIIDNIAGLNKIIIYPNPAKENVALKFNSSEKSNSIIYIYDINGKEITSKSYKTIIGTNILNIDIRLLENGVYFVVLKNNSYSVSVKMIVN